MRGSSTTKAARGKETASCTSLAMVRS
jgi:hypothetical protein